MDSQKLTPLLRQINNIYFYRYNHKFYNRYSKFKKQSEKTDLKFRMQITECTLEQH